MDELSKLYGILFDKGYYTKDFDVFKEQVKEEEYQNKVSLWIVTGKQ